MIKKLTIGILASGLVLSSIGGVFAETTMPAGSTLVRPLKTAIGSGSAGLRATATTEQPVKTANLQTRATQEIQRRTTALTELLTRVNSLKHISGTTKSTFSTQIQNEITSLGTLQTKIQGDTDPATLKTDVQSIITSYRVFALFMPQIRLLSGADSLLSVSDKLASFSANLQGRITQAQGAGQNVANLQTLLTSMQTEITDAKNQSAAITAEVSLLTPAGYPGNQSTLQDARTKLQTGVTDLKTAGQNARQIIQGLMTLSGNTATPSTASGSLNTIKPVLETSTDRH